MFKHCIILALLLFTVSIFSQTAEPPIGDGTEANPYQIGSLENLYWITEIYDTGGLHFIQTADIDASETINWFDGKGWDPIGENHHFSKPVYQSDIPSASEREVTSFRGQYDGQGHIIDRLFINRPDGWGVGLFASMSAGAVVRNLGLSNITVTGDDHVGGIAGQMNWAILENCFVEGSINGNGSVGGLTGYNVYIVAKMCYVKGFISGGVAGGLFGYASWTREISNLYVHADVTGRGFTGGILGLGWEVTIDRCYFTGTVYSTGSSFGPITGFLGENQVSIRNTYYNRDTAGFMGGRTTEEMTYPYAENTYVNWDFENTWVEDVYMFHNDGYPYLSWQTFHFEFIPPASLSASPGDEIVILNWQNPPDSLRDLLGYNVFRDDEQINDELLTVTEYNDTDVINKVTYRYYVTARYDDGESGPSNRVFATPYSSSSEPELIPFGTKLLGNYPNPFNPETKISFYLDREEKVKLEVFTIGGQKIATLLDDRLEQGEHSVVWTPRTIRGGDLSSGVYLYRLQTGEYDRTRKMLYLK